MIMRLITALNAEDYMTNDQPPAIRPVRPSRVLLAAAATALAVAACGSSSPTASPTASPAQHGTSTPATASAAALTARMKAAGLPITGVTVYNATTDPNHLLGRQGGYTSKDAWVVPAAVSAGAGSPSSDPGGIEFGGGIEVFATTADAQSRLEELKAFKAPFGDGYDYLAGTAILRLSNYLTPAQTARFRSAFEAAVQERTAS
jgi:hypothetical protein